ncbi:hypothetical protein OAL66_00035 [bacterium]|nr:hypothetical protein [bacterium]
MTTNILLNNSHALFGDLIAADIGGPVIPETDPDPSPQGMP